MKYGLSCIAISCCGEEAKTTDILQRNKVVESFLDLNMAQLMDTINSFWTLTDKYFNGRVCVVCLCVPECQWYYRIAALHLVRWCLLLIQQVVGESNWRKCISSWELYCVQNIHSSILWKGISVLLCLCFFF